MYTYEDKVTAEKFNEAWKEVEAGHTANLAKYKKLLAAIDTAVKAGQETYIGPVSGKVITITPEMKASYEKTLNDSIFESEKNIATAKRFISNNDSIIAEYEKGVKRKETIKKSSPEITPVINTNVASKIPTFYNPCAVGGALKDALFKVGQISGVVNSIDMIKDLAKTDPLAAAAAAAGLLGDDSFKKSADFLKDMDSKIKKIQKAAIPLGPISDIAKAVDDANKMVQSAADCLNSAVKSVTKTVNAGSSSVTNRVTSSVRSLDSSLDSLNSITGNKSAGRSYKAMKAKISNPITKLPKDIKSLTDKMDGISDISQMSAGLAKNLLNDVTSLTSAVQNITSGDPLKAIAGVGTLKNAKTLVNKTTGKIDNIKGKIDRVK